MKTKSTSSRRRGFTLVELLVVIAIILTLAGVALIATRAGLKAADASKTTKNMQQIHTALVTLQTEGVNTGLHAPGTFPPYKGSLQDAGQSNFVWWDLVALELDVAERDGSDFLWLQPYTKTPLQNPLSDKKLGQGVDDQSSLYDDPEASNGSYAYNANLGGDVSNDASEENFFKVRISQAEDLPNTIYFAETDDNVTSEGWLFDSIDNAPQGNYKDNCHCCMIDGHIEVIANSQLKNPDIFDFYTKAKDKNYGAKP